MYILADPVNFVFIFVIFFWTTEELILVSSCKRPTGTLYMDITNRRNKNYPIWCIADAIFVIRFYVYILDLMDQSNIIFLGFELS